VHIYNSDDFSSLLPHGKGLSFHKNTANIVKVGQERSTLCLIEVIHYVIQTPPNCVSVTMKTSHFVGSTLQETR